MSADLFIHVLTKHSNKDVLCNPDDLKVADSLACYTSRPFWVSTRVTLIPDCIKSCLGALVA